MNEFLDSYSCLQTSLQWTFATAVSLNWNTAHGIALLLWDPQLLPDLSSSSKQSGLCFKVPDELARPYPLSPLSTTSSHVPLHPGASRSSPLWPYEFLSHVLSDAVASPLGVFSFALSLKPAHPWRPGSVHMPMKFSELFSSRVAPAFFNLLASSLMLHSIYVGFVCSPALWYLWGLEPCFSLMRPVYISTLNMHSFFFLTLSRLYWSGLIKYLLNK